MAEAQPIDYFKLLWDSYQYEESQDAIKDSKEDVRQGFQMQNPWSQYQPAMGAGLLSLLADPSRITQTPGYQFSYDQGLQALMAKQAATGNRFSGRALKESMAFGQGLASQIYNQELNRYAQLAGATQPISGGIETGQALSQLGQQGAFNQGYFFNKLFENAAGSTPNTSPVTPNSSTAQPTTGSWLDPQPTTGNWLDPYNEDSVN